MNKTGRFSVFFAAAFLVCLLLTGCEPVLGAVDDDLGGLKRADPLVVQHTALCPGVAERQQDHPCPAVQSGRPGCNRLHRHFGDGLHRLGRLLR